MKLDRVLSKLKSLDRKQKLAIAASITLVSALFVMPVALKRLYDVPTLYTALGMIVLYFLIDQYMKRS